MTVKSKINPDLFGAPTPWYEWLVWGVEFRRPLTGIDEAFCSLIWQTKWIKRFFPKLVKWAANRSAQKM